MLRRKLADGNAGISLVTDIDDDVDATRLLSRGRVRPRSAHAGASLRTICRPIVLAAAIKASSESQEVSTRSTALPLGAGHKHIGYHNQDVYYGRIVGASSNRTERKH